MIHLILPAIMLFAFIGFALVDSSTLNGYYSCDPCNENGPGPAIQHHNVTTSACPRCEHEMRHHLIPE